MTYCGYWSEGEKCIKVQWMRTSGSLPRERLGFEWVRLVGRCGEHGTVNLRSFRCTVSLVSEYGAVPAWKTFVWVLDKFDGHWTSDAEKILRYIQSDRFGFSAYSVKVQSSQGAKDDAHRKSDPRPNECHGGTCSFEGTGWVAAKKNL